MRFAGVLLLLLIGTGPARAQNDDPFGEAIGKARAELEAERSALLARRTEIDEKRLALTTAVDERAEAVETLAEQWREQTRMRDERDSELRKLVESLDQADRDAAAARVMLVELRRNIDAQFGVVDAERRRSALEEIDVLLEGEQRLLAAADALLTLVGDHAKAAAGIRALEGSAILPDGREVTGKHLLLGDVLTLFAGNNAAESGVVTLVTGSQRPHVFTELDPELGEGIVAVAAGREATVPLDISSGAALRTQQSRLTLLEQFHAGGVVMYPIAVVALLGLLVGVIKLIALLRIRTDFHNPLDALLAKLRSGETDQARALADRARPPVRALMQVAVDKRDASRDDLEEALQEAILKESSVVDRWISVLEVGAAVAPLLGLLGTVTGMIETFRLISVFGTGDPRLLSGGISEALLTTEAGLIAAIPLLLLHAFLARRATAIADALEASAIGFLNRVRPEEWEPA
ncbi:MAG: MotA/TolQ/ExbB proton channel family protein [Planctomycetota bacterium]